MFLEVLIRMTASQLTDLLLTTTDVRFGIDDVEYLLQLLNESSLLGIASQTIHIFLKLVAEVCPVLTAIGNIKHIITNRQTLLDVILQ